MNVIGSLDIGKTFIIFAVLGIILLLLCLIRGFYIRKEGEEK